MFFLLFIVQVLSQCNNICVSLESGCMGKRLRCYNSLKTTLPPNTTLRPEVHIYVDIELTTRAPSTVERVREKQKLQKLAKMVKIKTTRQLLDECEAYYVNLLPCTSLRLRLIHEIQAKSTTRQPKMTTTTIAPPSVARRQTTTLEPATRRKKPTTPFNWG